MVNSCLAPKGTHRKSHTYRGYQRRYHPSQSPWDPGDKVPGLGLTFRFSHAQWAVLMKGVTSLLIVIQLEVLMVQDQSAGRWRDTGDLCPLGIAFLGLHVEFIHRDLLGPRAQPHCLISSYRFTS